MLSFLKRFKQFELKISLVGQSTMLVDILEQFTSPTPPHTPLPPQKNPFYRSVTPHFLENFSSCRLESKTKVFLDIKADLKTNFNPFIMTYL